MRTEAKRSVLLGSARDIVRSRHTSKIEGSISDVFLSASGSSNIFTAGLEVLLVLKLLLMWMWQMGVVLSFTRGQT